VKRSADKLTELIAEVESRIDFPEEEDISTLPVERIKKEIDAILKEIKELSDSYREGKVLREGYRVVIVGKPNVGKSSLLNRLLGADRAIVTDEPGTTRDIIEERIVLGGLPFILTDTAGLRARYQEKLAKPEEIGIQRTQAQLEAMRAEPAGGLLLVMLDSSQELTDEDKFVLKEAESAPHILIFNKSDLPQKLDTSALPHPFREEKPIKISALKGTGLKELIEALKQKRLSSSAKVKSEGYVVTSARHKSALDECASSLENALAVLENQPLEIIALELRLAREALNEIVGKALPDDILDIIFSRFCIGK
jgi:tRNA modification GTPase